MKLLGTLTRFLLIGALAALGWIGRSDFASAPQFGAGSAFGQTVASSDTERELEKKLGELEGQIDQYDQTIQQTGKEKASLQRDVSLLESEVKKLNLQIQATDLQIKRLTSRIGNTKSAIAESQIKISNQKEALAESLQQIYESDRVSLLEILLAENSITDFFANVNAVYALQLRAQTELDQVYTLRQVLQDQETTLTDAKEDQVATLLVQDAQKQDVASAKKAKDQLLAVTQGKESLYQELKSKAEKSAAEIRAQLFALRGGGELRFEDAYQFAKIAGNRTGVRPALILAVLSKESALGKNTGRCIYDQITSRGTPVMKETEQKVYLALMAELGFNPDSMSVSCPIVADGAYGGAMGIAQFMPSTWKLYKDRIAKIIGKVPSPWSPPDAFTATALYLADAGAKAQTYAAERQAAAKYYAGSRWQRYLRAYGDRVMAIAKQFQNEINILEGR